jgi:tetratricopeptide repeat protein 30
VGSNTDGNNVRSVGNSAILKETALIEAFNLKAAIEFQLKTVENAQEALSDMPPRRESELDAVTLHNQSLMHMDTDPNGSFRKLNFLLNNPPYPPEVFANLLILHCKHQHYDVAADLLAENSHLTFKLLSPDLYEFLAALVGVDTSPEEAYRNFDKLAGNHTDRLRKLTKSIQDARIASDSARLKDALEDYDQVPLSVSLTALSMIIKIALRIHRPWKSSFQCTWQWQKYIGIAKIIPNVKLFSEKILNFALSMMFGN